MSDTPVTQDPGTPETPAEAPPPTPEKAKKAPKAEKVVGAICTVAKLKDLQLPQNWNREKLTNIANLAQSIKSVGLVTALSVKSIPGSPGKYEIVDGARRFAALQENKAAEANITILPEMDPADSELASLAANACREDNNPWEMACAFDRAVSNGKTNKDIAHSLGKSDGHVSQYRGILRTPDSVQKAIKVGKLPPSVTRILLKLNYEDDQVFYDKIVEAMLGGLSLEDAAEKVDFHLAKKEAKAEGEGKSKKKSAAKTKAEKRRGPTVRIPDYADKEVAKKMEALPKKEAQEYLVHFADKLTKTSSKVKSAYHQGVLHGIEISYKLRGE